ncbi:helix-turn-helix domain-containing protein [Vibrio cholerae]|uniref:helix-turn-helix domain-containing protein n=1 Tax=Vibrio cholerae TaxID=666 RepID=UPI0002735386|nr:helix-turn-helix domain-containing protein [Vibrio cholerae]EGR4429550.1 helix-turn-helix domain-containing protein [Vibrio cholerae]EJH49289.1 transcriptional regulator, AsnC family [Vibrio cholerae HC-43B1]ELH0871317.1 helix-turn-helix domain-containing protein [Vibrio cholerae]HDL9454472.1 helix-turn-helix domain-containing protein [Vibrio cholerae]
MSKEEQQDAKKLNKRWGNQVIQEGWTAIPNVLIERQQALKLNPVEMNILLVLLKFWWENDKSPFPSKNTIADYINRDVSTVRKTLKSLEEKNLIKRTARFHEKGGQTSNVYDLSGLVIRLKSEAKILDGVRKGRKEEDGRIRRGIVE